MNKEIAEKVVDILYEEFELLGTKHTYKQTKEIWTEKMKSMGIDLLPAQNCSQENDICRGKYAVIVMNHGIKMLDPLSSDFSMLFVPAEIATKIAVLGSI